LSIFRTLAVSARARLVNAASSIRLTPYDGMISPSFDSQAFVVSSCGKHFCRTLMAM